MVGARTTTASSARLRRVAGTVACALAVAGAVAAPAAAQDAAAPPDTAFGPTTEAMQTATQIAVAHWGGTPCGGQITVTWSTLPESYNAQSTWSVPGTDAYAHPESNTNCSITFNPVAEFDWPKFCTVVVHEYGHLMGHDHSPDANDVMAAYYSDPLAECAAVGPDGAPVPPPAATAASRTTAAAPAPSTAASAKPKPRRVRMHRARVRSRHHHARHRVAVLAVVRTH